MTDGVSELEESLSTDLSRKTKNKSKKKKSDQSVGRADEDKETEDEEEEEELDEIEPDLLIELPILEKLNRGSARLRENNALTALGANRLMKLVTILDRNIYDAILVDHTCLLETYRGHI